MANKTQGSGYIKPGDKNAYLGHFRKADVLKRGHNQGAPPLAVNDAGMAPRTPPIATSDATMGVGVRAPRAAGSVVGMPKPAAGRSRLGRGVPRSVIGKVSQTMSPVGQKITANPITRSTGGSSLAPLAAASPAAQALGSLRTAIGGVRQARQGVRQSLSKTKQRKGRLTL
jgi:hypothetical protein